MKPKKHNEPWTPAELRHMRKLARMKLANGRRPSARFVAAVIGRTPGAVKYKAMVEGVHFRAINQPAGVQRRPAQRRKLSRLRKARAA